MIHMIKTSKNRNQDNWMPFLVVIVGQACSLRCRDCANFAPYAPSDMMKYSFEDIKKSLNIIFDNLGGIQKVQIQGGEPFLCSYLDKLLLWLFRSKRVGEITISTNGTIIPGKKLIRAIRKCRVTVSISNYGKLYRKELLEIHRLFDDYNIKYLNYNFATQSGKWIKLGGIDTAKEDDEDIVSERFEKCPFKWCMTLERNILGYCSRSIVASRVLKKFEGGAKATIWIYGMLMI